MEIKVESKVKVEVGDVTLKLKREEAHQLYNALKTELGITDSNGTWPYEWVNPRPYYPYLYVSCPSVWTSEDSDYNSSGVVTVTSSASSASIHPDDEEINEFLTSVKEYNSF